MKYVWLDAADDFLFLIRSCAGGDCRSSQSPTAKDLQPSRFCYSLDALHIVGDLLRFAMWLGDGKRVNRVGKKHIMKCDMKFIFWKSCNFIIALKKTLSYKWRNCLQIITNNNSAKKIKIPLIWKLKKQLFYWLLLKSKTFQLCIGFLSWPNTRTPN